ncbi:MAG: YicC family protein [Proteobacteria bacterium]|nr:YicC family protein [Pseudomonadota bacterium]MCH7893638.1 YicC family protein [Pseudomonadota bacterium]
MIRSMTGYARLERTTEYGTLSWELRSVNHRYLDLGFRMPDEFRSMEPAFRTQVSAVLKRGKIECGLRLTALPGTASPLTINMQVLDQLLAHTREIAEKLPAAAAPNPLEVLRWPGLLGEPKKDPEPAQKAATELLGETLAQLSQNRASEGERIREMLITRCETMDEIVRFVREKMPDVMSNLRQRLRDRIAQLCEEVDNERIEIELAMLAQKFDVDEEMDRLSSHLTEVRSTIDRNDPIGRRLDFLMQELNREANTLSSKSQDTEVTRAAVELKVLIEQMREQIQNIE